MPNINEVWKDPVWSKVIATAIIAGCAAILATFRGWWPAIGGFVAKVWSWLGDSSEHQNWLLLVLWLALALLVVFIVLIAIANFKSQPGSPPRNWPSYTTDQFFGLQWAWKLGDDGFIHSVFALCLDCKCQVYARNTGHYGESKCGFYCDVCGRDKATFDGDPDAIEQKVKLRIAKNLRTGEWANAKVN